MAKLLAKYAANPTKENAARVVQHAMKHPMSLCLLTEAELAIYDRAFAA